MVTFFFKFVLISLVYRNVEMDYTENGSVKSLAGIAISHRLLYDIIK